MKVDPSSPLALTGLQAVIALLRQRLRKPLDEEHVEFELDAVNAELIVRSLERSVKGDYGKYSGEARLSYQKLNLNTVLPYAIHYTGEYPTTFLKLRQWLYETYQLQLEEGEFRLPGNADVPLTNNVVVNLPPDPQTGEIALVARTQSGRFIAGSTLRLIVSPSNGPIRLPALVPSGIKGDLAWLSYA